MNGKDQLGTKFFEQLLFFRAGSGQNGLVGSLAAQEA